MMQIKGAWYKSQYPTDIVIMLSDNRIARFQQSPFREIAEEELEPTPAVNPATLTDQKKHEEVPEYLLRFYGLEK